MAQVALSRAQPSCPHCPPSRSPRARPFTFTSAAGRELGDRAALVCSQGTQSSIAAPKAHLGGTQCMPLSAAKAKIQCKCLHLCTFVQKKYRVLAGPSESPPKWSMYVMVSPALMAPTLVTASAMMAEARTSAAWAAASRRMCRKRHNFRFLSELRLQRALYCRAFKLYIAPPRRRARAAGLAIFRHIPYPVPRTRGGRVYACSSQRCLFYLQLLYSRPLMRSGITYTTVHKTVLLFAYAPRAPTASHQTWAGTLRP